MAIFPVGRIPPQSGGIKVDKLNVLVAQRSLEAATQNQAKEQGGQANSAKTFAHPYLGHNVDIYV